MPNTEAINISPERDHNKAAEPVYLSAARGNQKISIPWQWSLWRFIVLIKYWHSDWSFFWKPCCFDYSLVENLCIKNSDRSRVCLYASVVTDERFFFTRWVFISTANICSRENGMSFVVMSQ